jgi:hypothetical protein
MKKTLLVLSLLIYLMGVHAQEISQKSFFANEASGQLTVAAINELEKAFNKYAIYNLDVSTIDDFIKKDGSLSSIDIDFGGTFQWQLIIEQYNILGENYSMREATPNGIITHTEKPTFTYRGVNGSNTGDLVYLSILPDFMSGFIQKNGECYFIEPVKDFDKNASNHLFVMYNSKDVKTGSNCAVTSAQKTINKIGQPDPTQSTSRDIAACASTEIAIAATNDFVTKYGGASATQTKVISQLNTVNGLYAQAAVDIKYVLAQFYTATSNQITADNQTEITTCLSDFKTWGNAGGFTATYDVATLWVGRDLFYNSGAIGGFAYGGNGIGSGVICTSNKYNCVEDKNSTNLNGVLQSHELGHNWGCVHQSGSTYIMNPSVSTSSNVWTSACTATISDTKSNSSCTSPCATGINNIARNDKLIIYPNPVTSTVSITLKEAKKLKVSIYNVLGELFVPEQINNGTAVLNLSSLPNGIYMLRAESDDIIINKTIVVSH